MDAIYDVRIRFDRDGEHRLIVQPGEGVQGSRLSGLEVRMLGNCRIPGVMPMHAAEINEEVRLQYFVTDYDMLYYALKMRHIDSEDVIRLLSAIVETVGRSSEFMLQEARFRIHERLVFIGEEWEQVRLLYVPYDCPAAPSLNEQFAHFIESLLNRMKESGRTADPRISDFIPYCMDPGWSLAGLRRKLLEANGGSGRFEYSIEPESKIRADEIHEKKAVPFEEPANLSRQSQNGWRFDFEWSEMEEASTRPRFNQSRKPVLYSAIAIFAIAWAYALSERSEGPYYIAFGTAFWLGSALLWGFDGTESNAESSSSEMDGDEYRFEPVTDSQPAANIMYGMPESIASNDSISDLADYYRQLGDRTTLLTPKDVSMLTVALDEVSLKRNRYRINKPRPVLELWRDQSLERIVVDKDSFLIGRGDTTVDLAIAAPDVSRVHAEICVEADETVLRDLKAKNGTSLNDKWLVPYERYPLRDGDVIRIGACSLVFKMVGA